MIAEIYMEENFKRENKILRIQFPNVASIQEQLQLFF